MKVKLLSRVRLFATPWTAAYQAPPSMGFSRQEYWSGVPLPSCWDRVTGARREGPGGGAAALMRAALGTGRTPVGALKGEVLPSGLPKVSGGEGAIDKASFRPIAVQGNS